MRAAAGFELFLGELSRQLLAATPEQFPALVESILERVAGRFDTDRVLLQRLEDDRLRVRFAWGRPEIRERRPPSELWSPLHWVVSELRAGRDIVLRNIADELPAAAETERAYAAQVGLTANLTLPVTLSGRFLWAISTGCFQRTRDWTPQDVDRLRLVGETLVAAAERIDLELESAAYLAEVEELRRRHQEEATYLRAAWAEEFGGDEIVGSSSALLRVMTQIDRVAPTPSTVLLTGETGTGKELLARAIHARSPRREGPLVRINCAAVPASLIESELFGHERGAFTGALAARAGRFEVARGGTLFLDEVGDLPQEVQIKLLRVLQEREFERVGSNRPIRADVRVVAATHRDLERSVEERRFRSDLYFRLNVFPIRVPPLRERREDVPLLTWAFVERLQGSIGKRILRIRDRDLDALRAYDWPGNVRELQNVVERALILSPGETLAIAEAFHPSPTAGPAGSSATADAGDRFDELARRHIGAVIDDCGGKISGPGGAAERLGLHPNTLRSRMKKLGIGRSRA
ncbi:MAG: sigma 54-interacting transcriptional regulator [Holophagales bacterium]|nr:sigma 54-interacting transcriptional regulator [Holophagales bacterium]